MIITTRYRETYIIHDDLNREVERTDMKFTPSESWTFTGFYMQKAFWHLQYFSIPDMQAYLDQGNSLTFKNGNPKFTWWDIDHGARRIHGNIQCHGIVHISF